MLFLKLLAERLEDIIKEMLCAQGKITTEQLCTAMGMKLECNQYVMHFTYKRLIYAMLNLINFNTQHTFNDHSLLHFFDFFLNIAT